MLHSLASSLHCKWQNKAVDEWKHRLGTLFRLRSRNTALKEMEREGKNIFYTVLANLYHIHSLDTVRRRGVDMIWVAGVTDTLKSRIVR